MSEWLKARGPEVREGLSRLSEREREVLRLLVRGHDIKSIARQLGISTTAVNERLRQSRQKLGVSSSREAARMVASEEGDHNISVDMETGIAAPGLEGADGERPPPPARKNGPSPTILWSGLAMLAIATVTLAVLAAAPERSSGATPKVVSTSPAPGAAVEPGPLMLKVTFDRPMLPGSYSFVQTSAETYPQCGANVPQMSQDRRTFSLRCTIVAGRSYEIWFNRPPFMNFKSAEGVPAEPFQLLFRARPRYAPACRSHERRRKAAGWESYAPISCSWIADSSKAGPRRRR